MNRSQLLKRKYDLLQKRLTIQSRTSFKHFVTKTMPDYQWNWHHKKLCDSLEALQRGDITRLMVFEPPRHGKSQLCSRHFPPFCFGLNPDTKIIATSYSADLASDMNTDCQRIMDSIEYQEVFPNTKLSGRNVVSLTLPKRNSNRFDIVNHRGYYVSAGVGGAITGKGADIAIIDDPVKNAEEAESKVFRDKVWKWYGSVLYTRLEKDAKILLVMTRWHEDDLAGRLIKQMKDNADADQWTIINLPAIKEDDLNPDDPRDIGEALWPSKYDVKTLTSIFATIGTRYKTSLYQQKPSPTEGSIIKKSWFGQYAKSQLPSGVVNFYIDSAYTDNTSNDPTAIIAWTKAHNSIYIIHCTAKHMTLPQLLDFLPVYLSGNGYTGGSTVYIEPKASGKSIAQQIKQNTAINIVEEKASTDSKITRAYAATPTLESGRVLIPESAPWVESFLSECAQFPNGSHDDKVDCLTGAIRMAFGKPSISMSGIQY